MSIIRLKTISKNINLLMGNMSIKELADKSSIPYSTLLPIIKGERDFGISRLLQIAEALNVDINKIIEGAYDISNMQTKKSLVKVRYLVAFLTNNRATRCAILDITDNTKETAIFPFPTFVTSNAFNTIDAFKGAIKQLLKNRNPNFGEVAVYSSALGYEHIYGREKLLTEGRKNFCEFILEPDWHVTFNALYPEQSGILITVNDGIAISYSNDKGKTVGKHQGYTFPISDEAGAIWLGCQAIKHAINVTEGVEERTRLSDHVLALFNSDLNLLATKVFDNPRDTYIEVATIVRTLSARKEKSYELIKHSFDNIWQHIIALDKQLDTKLPIKISGDLADTYEEFIPKGRFKGSDFQHEDEEFIYAFNALNNPQLEAEGL